ncbi:MAG: hypothetical protein ACTHPD_11975 [Rhizomicrobium sp.]
MEYVIKHHSYPKNAVAQFINDTARNLASKFKYQTFFLTLTYKEPKSSSITHSAAETKLKEFYKAVLLPLLVHPKKYNSKRNRPLQPFIFAFIDEAGSKPGKGKVVVGSHSSPSTLHHHALVLAHPTIAQKLSDLIGNNTLLLPMYLRLRGRISLKTTDLQKVELSDVLRVAEYASDFAVRQQVRQENWMTVLGPSIEQIEESFKRTVTTKRFYEQNHTEELSMTKIDWTKTRHMGSVREIAFPDRQPERGPHTNISRGAVRIYSASEKQAWLKMNSEKYGIAA